MHESTIFAGVMMAVFGSYCYYMDRTTKKSLEKAENHLNLGELGEAYNRADVAENSLRRGVRKRSKEIMEQIKKELFLTVEEEAVEGLQKLLDENPNGLHTGINFERGKTYFGGEIDLKKVSPTYARYF